MDYFTDVLATFLELGTLQLCCCLWRVLKLLDLIKNIFNDKKFFGGGGGGGVNYAFESENVLKQFS